ncbi:hypothetical protein HDU93_002402, partial [Gonapodya sp. JEL0774]
QGSHRHVERSRHGSARLQLHLGYFLPGLLHWGDPQQLLFEGLGCQPVVCAYLHILGDLRGLHGGCSKFWTGAGGTVLPWCGR